MNSRRIIPGESDQGVLFSTHYIGDRLSPNHEVFEFRKLLDKMDLSPITDMYGAEGGSMYSPRDLFAIVCYGYFKRFVSSYLMAEAVETRVDFIYLAGGHRIKRRTICEFRRRHGGALIAILAESVKLAAGVGLIDKSKIFALDGTKIRSSANRDQRKTRDEWAAVQNELIDSIEDFLNEWEKNDKLEEDIEEEQAQKMRQVRENIKNLPRQKLKSPVADSLKEDNGPSSTDKDEKIISPNDDKNKYKIETIEDVEKAIEKALKIYITLENTTTNSINLTDPDSRLMKYGKNAHESYNGQIISNNGFIVAATVSTSENDQSQLEPMVEMLLKNIPLGENETINLGADAGYNKGKNLAYLETIPEIDPYISMHRRRKIENKYSKDKFEYSEQNDEYVCPKGKILEHLRDITKKDQKGSLYGATIEKCIYCPAKNQCVTGEDVRRGYRTIEDDAYAIFRNAMRAKMQLEESKQIYRKRSGEVEPRFGTLKTKGMRYLRLRWLDGAKTEFLFASLASNLGRIIKLRSQNLLPV
jgi:transposase